ncbi:MAG TPA: hypothetical protein VGQ35_00955 [Dongiaceae bacterium]|nr:hypothetical protein [Dongiaceae bacterium]
MAASRSVPRRTARCRAAAIPDNRLIVASAMVALATLLLMLVAGAAKADDVDYMCWEVASGRLECETLQSVEATCAAIAGQHELCPAVVAAQAAGAATPYPANTHYTTVKPTRAGLEKWNRYKPHVN